MCPHCAKHAYRVRAGTSTYTKVSGASLARVGQTFLEAAVDRTPIAVKPIEEENEYESRRVWKDVADGIRKGDFEAASVAKSLLEVRAVAM